jgi:teichuronic acid biosynthesis glycosyltransferase TuaG
MIFMDAPLISVIIPAYNAMGTIAGAVESALAQNVPLEIIVVDDGGNDGLETLLQDKAILLKNEENLGAAESRNRGIRHARGKYVAFLDADDLWLPGKLQKQLDAIGETVLCCTARQLMTPEGVCTGRVIGVKERITYRELLKHNSINCSSVLLRRDVALEFPMEHADSHEDYILWLKILQKYDEAVGINEPLLRYRLSNTGKSGSKLNSAKMTFRVYRYMGFGTVKSLICFCSYAIHGTFKYLMSKRGSK